MAVIWSTNPVLTVCLVFYTALFQIYFSLNTNAVKSSCFKVHMLIFNYMLLI